MLNFHDQIADIGNEVIQYIENAAGEMGHHYDEGWHSMDSAAAVEWERLKADGIKKEYRGECMADWYYDQVDWNEDMIGDKAYDECTINKDALGMPAREAMGYVLLWLSENMHNKSSRLAAANILERHCAFEEKHKKDS